MPKIHKFKLGGDCRGCGQTDFEYLHSTECGYVRDSVTNDDKKVTCFYCKRKLNK